MSKTSAARGLDHLVIGVADLDAAGAFYASLGFRVGARNRHPWGTENRIVQFPGAFLELISVGDAAAIPPHAPRRFSFGAFVRDALARGEGMSMLALESGDSAAAAAAFGAAGIGDFEPFSFERQAHRPDGSQVRVAFTLAFAENRAAPECGFFLCQHHEPRNFWNPAFQQHENGATGLAAVFLVASEPQGQGAFLSAYSGALASPTAEGGLCCDLPRGRIDVLGPPAAAALLGEGGAAGKAPHFGGFAVAIPDAARLEALLAQHDIARQRRSGRVVLPASAALGCAIVFEPG